MRIVWHGHTWSDWFEVWAIDAVKGLPEKRIFVGHPEDFWLEFPVYAERYGLMDVTEEVKE